MSAFLTAAAIYLAPSLLVFAWIGADRYLARRAEKKRAAAVVADQNRRAALDREADELAAEIVALVYGQKLKAADEVDFRAWDAQLEDQS